MAAEQGGDLQERLLQMAELLRANLGVESAPGQAVTIAGELEYSLDFRDLCHTVNMHF